ncbi:hypothetical protein STEG23_009430 [Scotinomys teguina]
MLITSVSTGLSLGRAHKGILPSAWLRVCRAPRTRCKESRYFLKVEKSHFYCERNFPKGAALHLVPSARLVN